MNRTKFYATFEADVSVIGNKITGVIPYNSLGQDLGGYKPRLVAGLFSKAMIRNKDIFALVGHDRSKPLARSSNGSLVLTDAVDGLHISFEIPEDLSWGKDALAAISHKLIVGFSFGGYIESETMVKEFSETVQNITEFDLHEVSVVYNPVFLDKANISRNDMDNATEQQEPEEETPVVEVEETIPETPDNTKYEHKLYEMKIQNMKIRMR